MLLKRLDLLEVAVEAGAADGIQNSHSPWRQVPQ